MTDNRDIDDIEEIVLDTEVNPAEVEFASEAGERIDRDVMDDLKASEMDYSDEERTFDEADTSYHPSMKEEMESMVHSEMDEGIEYDGAEMKTGNDDLSQPQEESEKKYSEDQQTKDEDRSDFEEQVDGMFNGTKRSKVFGFIAGIVAVVFRVIHVAVTNLFFDGNERFNISKIFNQTARSTFERETEKQAQNNSHKKENKALDRASRTPEKEGERTEPSHEEKDEDIRHVDSKEVDKVFEESGKVKMTPVQNIAFDPNVLCLANQADIRIIPGMASDDKIYIQGYDEEDKLSNTVCTISKEKFLKGDATELAYAMYTLKTKGEDIPYMDYVKSACHIMNAVSVASPDIESLGYYSTDQSIGNGIKFMIAPNGDFLQKGVMQATENGVVYSDVVINISESAFDENLKETYKLAGRNMEAPICIDDGIHLGWQTATAEYERVENLLDHKALEGDLDPERSVNEEISDISPEQDLTSEQEKTEENPELDNNTGNKNIEDESMQQEESVPEQNEGAQEVDAEELERAQEEYSMRDDLEPEL